MTQEEIFACILEQVRDVEPDLADRELGPTDSLRKLGLDSMQRVEILMLSMEALEIEVPRDELNSPQNLGELAALFHQKKAG